MDLVSHARLERTLKGRVICGTWQGTGIRLKFLDTSNAPLRASV